MKRFSRFNDIFYSIIITVAIIIGSIGVGYLVSYGREYAKDEPKIQKETLILECKKTGRNYDCDPKVKK